MKTPATRKISFLCVLAVTVLHGMGHSAILSGVVIDKESANEPVPGVLVSAGHSLTRTITDSLGRFSIDAPFINTVDFPMHPSRTFAKVPWDRRKLTIDFSRAPGIAGISIFGLNGVCLYSYDIKRGTRIVHIPALARGIFLMKATFDDNASCSWKWNALEARGMFKLPLHSRRSLGKAASSGVEALLLFRHDDYFPFERRFTDPGENLVITMSPDVRRFVFDRAKIHSYQFTVSHDDSIAMEKTAFDEIYVPADFSFNGVPFGKVGLRFKGSKYYLLKDCFDSLGRVTTNPLCAKASMKVKFDKYTDSARFYALKRLNMHAMSDEPSKMREMLCYHLFRDMGIYAPRTAYMKLFVNGSFWGLFTAVEEIDGRFTKSRWPEFGDGNVFKEVWPNRTYRSYYEAGLVTNDNPGDGGDGFRMVDFARAILASTKETFVQNVSPFMDLDYWCRYIAVDRAIHNADGIFTWYCDQKLTYKANHNYYFYQEENPGGKIWLMPWDLPATLTRTDPIVDDLDMPDWYVEPDSCSARPIWSGQLGYPPHCDNLIALTADALWDNFAKAGEQLLNTCFKADRLQKEIDDYATLIEPTIAQDPTIELKQWQNNVKDLRSTVGILNTTYDDYIHKRTPVVDTAGFTTPFPDSGFLIDDRVNNFEFTPVTPLSSWTQVYTSTGSTVSLSIDTAAPIWGNSDLKCSFVFTPKDTPAAYAEWSEVHLYFKQPVDFTKLKRIKAHLKYDAPRGIFVHLLSNVYDSSGVKDTHGWWSSYANTTGKQYTFEMSQIEYPSWGDPDNPDILDTVLTSVTGIGFGPRPRFDNKGELSVSPDSGYLRIDNIIFEK
jgi:spore coat protein H